MQAKMSRARWLSVGCMLVATVGSGAALAAWSPPAPAEPFPVIPVSGREWRVTLIGSSGCVPSRSVELREALGQLRMELGAQAVAIGDGMSVLGVATDADAGRGIRYLRHLGTFDEVSAGLGWRNGGLLQLRRVVGAEVEATPTVIISVRTVSLSADQQLVVEKDSVVKVLVGLREIVGFVRSTGTHDAARVQAQDATPLRDGEPAGAPLRSPW